MAKQCVHKMTIIDKNGVEVESRLFNDLLKATTRQNAVNIYNKVTDPDIQEEFKEFLIKDDNGELLSGPVKVVSKLITMQQYIDELDQKYGRYDRLGNVINYTMEAARDIVKPFNQSQQNPLNQIFHMQSRQASNGKFHVKVLEGGYTYPTVTLYSAKSEELEQDYNISLNNKIKELCKTYGISIGFLNKLEEQMGIKGVLDTNMAQQAADGLIELIRISQGQEGQKAIPEEFAHAIVELLGDSHPIVNRLLNLLNNEDIFKEVLGEQYDSYNTAYKGDKLLLAKEVLGKLTAKHFLQNEEISSKPYKNLLQRFINTIKDFFKNLGSKNVDKKIEDKIKEAEAEISTFSKNILANKFQKSINLRNLNKDSVKLYSLNDRIEAQKKVLEKIVQDKVKQLKIASKRDLKAGDYDSIEELNQLEENLEKAQYAEGISNFVSNAFEALEKQQIALKNVAQGNSNAKDLNQVAAILRSAKNFTAYYTNNLKAIKEEIAMDNLEETNLFNAGFRQSIKDLVELCDNLETQTQALTKEVVIQFLEPFVGNSLEIQIGKDKGITMKLEDLIERGSQDITFLDRMLDSLGDSSDQMLRLFGHAVDTFKLESQRKGLEYIKNIQALQKELESKGVKNTEFMYEKLPDGKISGDYINDLDLNAFGKAADKVQKELSKKYESFWDENYRKEYQKWYNDNTELIGTQRVPRSDIYSSPAYAKLNDAQKAYYKGFMSIKKELDAFLPQGASLNLKAVQIRKDWVERIKSSSSLKDGIKTFKESIKDLFIRREQDTDFGNDSSKSNTILDFEGKKVMNLPIYFLKRLSNMEDLSLDATSGLAAYAQMAVDFNEMSQAIHLLELTRDVFNKRDMAQTQGNKTLKQTINAYGREFTNTLTKSGDATNFMARLNDYFDMQIYGRFRQDEGEFGDTAIDKAKVADFINRMTSLNNLALNGLAGVSNVATGSVMMMQEALAGQYFNTKDLLKADSRYGKMLPSLLGNIGNNIKTDKLSLIIEKFNVMQDYEARAFELQMDRKKFSKLFGMNTLFFMTHCGEHFMQSRTLLSLISKYKMKSSTGEIVDLYDALEVVPVDGKNLKNGGKLVVKQGYTKEDGSSFDQKDFDSISERSRYINGKLHGIYNKQDMNAIQKYALGRMAMMFRKWMRSSWNRRVAGAAYNYQAQEWNEGYYRTTGRFALQLMKDLKSFQLSLLMEDWSKLSKIEKANIKRAGTEIVTFFILSLSLSCIDWPDDDSYFNQSLEYQLRRLQTEIGAMTPTPSIFQQAFTILQSPAAGVDYLQRAFKVFNFTDYFDEIESGRYKGMYKGEKYWLDLIPMNRTLYKVFNPEEASAFYKNNS